MIPWAVVIVALFAGTVYLIYREHTRSEDDAYKIAGLRQDLEVLNARLQSTQREMTAFSDTAFDAMLMVDADRRILLINKAARDLFGVQDSPAPQTLMSVMSVSRQHELDT